MGGIELDEIVQWKGVPENKVRMSDGQLGMGSLRAW